MAIYECNKCGMSVKTSCAKCDEDLIDDVLKLDNLFIFYPSLRYFLSAKMAGIKKIFTYPFFNHSKLIAFLYSSKLTTLSFIIFLSA